MDTSNKRRFLLVTTIALAVIAVILLAGMVDVIHRGGGFLFVPSFTPSATNTPLPTDTATHTPEPTSTEEPSFTPTFTMTASPTSLPTETYTPTPTFTPTVTDTPVPTFDETAFAASFYSGVTQTAAAYWLMQTPTVTPTVTDDELVTGMRSKNNVTGKEIIFIKTETDPNVKGIWMDWTEVTNAEYQLCCYSGFCEPPLSDKAGSILHYYSDPQYSFYPVVNVTRSQAQVYCAWVGMELCGFEDWKLASGTRDFLSWSSNINHIMDHPADVTTGSFILGNVWEWTRMNTESGDAVIAGGSWRTSVYDSDNQRSGALDPESYADDLGFRCVLHVR